MKETKIYHVLAFLFGVALVLGAISLVVPKKGWDLGLFTLNFMTKEEVISPTRQETKDITSIVESVNTEVLEEPKQVKHANVENGNVGAPGKVNYEINNASEVEKTTGSTKFTEQFFQKLKELSGSKKKIRILHFGDSQIEGDRMTGFIRQRMQEQFGGTGPGLIPAINVYPTLAFQQSYSSNFVRYTCFGGPRLSNRKYGVFNSAARFTPEVADSTMTEPVEAWIEIRPGSGAYNRAKIYNNVKMFYNSCTEPCKVKVYQGANLIHEEDLKNDGGSHTLTLKFNSTPSSLRYVFTSKLSPNINGFSLEGDFGLQVDNIGMRGSSGTFFGSINQTSFANMMKELNVEMVIMQFGGNSMPAMKDSSDVRNYARYFQGQLRTLRKLKPDLAIMVIGPSDMSKLKDGIYETYPLLPYCVSQMKKVSLEMNAGFWNLFDAMGGKNSMPAWVEKDLARPDHIHFSIKGASVASQLFYDALMAEYLKFTTK
jgi:lysophospholipase L1-like esterase